MSVAYLILAHNNPRHLARLIDKISTGISRSFIHVDLKSSIDEFTTAVKNENAEFVMPRVRVYWAGFSIVEATIILLEHALAHPAKFDRFVLLSGTDYPLRSACYIEQFFAKHPDTEFINLVPMPNDQLGKPLSRLVTYCPNPGELRWITLSRKVLQRLRLLPRERDYTKVLGELTPYGGSQWWALSRAACERIVEITYQRPEVLDFFRNTHCPDETYFHTLLGNTEFQSCQRRGLTYSDWSSSTKSPSWLNEGHVAKFRQAREFVVDDAYGRGELLFARKCPDPSDEIVAAIDTMITEKDRQTWALLRQ